VKHRKLTRNRLSTHWIGLKVNPDGFTECQVREQDLGILVKITSLLSWASLLPPPFSEPKNLEKTWNIYFSNCNSEHKRSLSHKRWKDN
jgi:hypothetical protein